MQGLKIITVVLLCLTFSACNNDNVKDEDPPPVGISIDSLIRRVVIPSQAMGKVFNAHVVLPESYFLDSTYRSYPVLYLLHGYSGKFSDWYEKVPSIRRFSSQYDMIIVAPEGGHNSWYLDSPKDSTSMYFTYISQEVPSYVDANFRTYNDARFRAIAGLSMGGHGALSIALSLPNWFGAAGSMSGVVDLVPYQNDWEIKSHLGEFETDSISWQKHSVLGIAGTRRNIPKLIIDCGTEDELIDVNRDLHERLFEVSIPHTYIERPGGHSWLYWEEALEVQLQFFDRVFKEG